jgi:hypothetical protein
MFDISDFVRICKISNGKFSCKFIWVFKYFYNGINGCFDED